MISQQDLYNELSRIAEAHNLQGDGIDVQKDWLSYQFSNYFNEIANAFMESNLSTATRMNNKILQCMNVMYSVYRGRNPRLVLQNYTQNGYMNKGLYDLVYTSNNFYIYAIGKYDHNKKKVSDTGLIIDPYTDGRYEFLISKSPKYVSEIVINEDNKYFIDLQIDYKILENISEDIAIYINGVKQSTTRLFYKHINSIQSNKIIDYSDPYEDNIAESDSSDLFVLTIPNYGIRIYKKGYFSAYSVIRIEAFEYCTKTELVANYSSELRRIRFNGFDMEVYIDEQDAPIQYDDSENIINQTVNYIKDSVERDNIKSIQYNAMAFNHVQSQIMSNSDVDCLFTEYFKDIVLSASHIVTQTENGIRLFIYYIPRNESIEITQSEINDFIELYGSYYIGKMSEDNYDVVIIKSPKKSLILNCTLVVSGSVDLRSQLDEIFSNYQYKLPRILKVNKYGGLPLIKTDLNSTGVTIPKDKLSQVLNSDNLIESDNNLSLINDAYTNIKDQNDVEASIEYKNRVKFKISGEASKSIVNAESVLKLYEQLDADSYLIDATSCKLNFTFDELTAKLNRLTSVSYVKNIQFIDAKTNLVIDTDDKLLQSSAVEKEIHIDNDLVKVMIPDYFDINYNLTYQLQ